MAELTDDQLQRLYTWIDEIPLSRPKRSIARDFADGVLMAEVIRHYFPALVELHNYPAANSTQQKMYNWNTLNAKVLRKLGYNMPRDDIEAVLQCRPGAVERVLNTVQMKMARYRARGRSSTPGRGASPAPGAARIGGAAAGGGSGGSVGRGSSASRPRGVSPVASSPWRGRQSPSAGGGDPAPWQDHHSRGGGGGAAPPPPPPPPNHFQRDVGNGGARFGGSGGGAGVAAAREAEALMAALAERDQTIGEYKETVRIKEGAEVCS